MSESINFIPANELPVAEGDEVSVLCLENGELKQKPASGLGGGKADAVLRFADDGNCEFVSGSYGELVAKLQAGEMTRIEVVGIVNGYYTASTSCSVTLRTDGGDVIARMYGTTSSVWNLYIGADYAYLD